MPGHTSIEWTNATWNPVTGCAKVSRGCDNCYAHALAHGRLSRIYRGQPPVLDSDEARDDPFAVRTWPKRLDQPGAWRDARMIFVNSMSDLFHADVPTAFVRSVFEVMLEVSRHTYQVLTKRPSRATRFIETNLDLFPTGSVPSHIWLGTSVEDQEVIYRVAHLRKVPATTRFLSCEPLLGPLDLDLEGIAWVIVGGESGPNRRPMDEQWVVSIQRQCGVAGVPFFFKQWGGYTPKAGGRDLRGRTWDEFPAPRRARV